MTPWTAVTWSHHMIEGIDHMTLLRSAILTSSWYLLVEPNFSQIKMGDQEPSYVAFFGVMGATSAMVFSGEYVVLV